MISEFASRLVALFRSASAGARSLKRIEAGRALSITGRLTLILVLFSATLLGGLGALAYTSGRAGLQEAATSELLTRAIEKQAALESWIARGRTDIAVQAETPIVAEQAAILLSAAAGSPEAKAARDRLLTEFRPHVGSSAGFTELFLMEAKTGQVLVSTDPSKEGQLKESRSFFVNGKAGPYVSDMYYSATLGRPAMTAAAPVATAEGRLLGVLAGRLDLAVLNLLVNRRTGLRQTEDTFLTNSSGLLVTQPRFLPNPAVLQTPLHTEAVVRCLGGNSGVISTDDYRGVRALVSYHWLPEEKMCLIVKIDHAEAYAPSLAFSRTIALTGGLGLALAIALAVVLARTFTRPILALQIGAARLGQGDLQYRVAVKSSDEIGRLAAAFNEMAENLQHSLGQTAYGERMLSALSQAAQAVQRARTPEDVYQALGQQVRQLGYHDMVFTVAEDRAHLTVSALTFDTALLKTVENLLGFSAIGYRFALPPDGIWSQTVTSGEARFTDQIVEPMAAALPKLARPILRQIASSVGIEQMIVAPLRIGVHNELVGLLTIMGTGLLETDVPAVTTFAGQAAIALENARLYEEVEGRATELGRRVNELIALNNMAQIVVETVDTQRMCSRALAEALALVGVDAGTLFLLEPHSGDMVMNAHRGLTDEFVQAAGRLKKGEGLTWQAAETGEPVVMSDMSKYPGALKGYVQKEHIQSAAVIPLVGRTGVVGTMNLIATQPRTFDDSGLELLMTIGRQVAIGLERAHLHAALQAELAEHKLTEEQLAARTSKLEQSNRDLQDFAYVAAHDLQEPLRKVQAFGGRLADKYADAVDATGRDYLNRMLDASGRMQRLINDLLVFSRVSTRAQSFTKVDLDIVVRRVLSDLENRIERANARVEIIDELPAIQVDPTQMHQLLQNLIGNALKFQREGIPPVIRVSAQVSSNECQIVIEDNGIGFDTQYLDRIFKPFQRLHTRDEYEGSGIGLAICRRIVERHRGKIAATSTPGKGATFLVTLPVHQPGGDI